MLDFSVYGKYFISSFLIIWIFSVFLFSSAGAQEPTGPEYPPKMSGARVETYKTIGDVDLQMWIFEPRGHEKSDSRPAVVFFFGGGWSGGTPAQFQKQCEYLAGRGMVAISADYRVRTRHDATINICVADAKSAIRWVRKNATQLGIDPNRIVASGGSAGGHLAAAVATLPAHDDSNDDMSVSARPNALVLFNPAAVLAPIPGKLEAWTERLNRMAERMGAEPESVSPFHHVTLGVGPTLIFHGIADMTVPYRSVELFSEKMRAEGNRCELVGYKGEEHGFFNYGRKDNAAFIDTVNRMDQFLVSLGYLSGVPEVVTIADASPTQ